MLPQYFVAVAAAFSPVLANARHSLAPSTLTPILAADNTTGFLCNQNNECGGYCCDEPKPKAFQVQFDKQSSYGSGRAFSMRIFGIPGMPDEMWVPLYYPTAAVAAQVHEYVVDGLPASLYVGCGAWCTRAKDENDEGSMNAQWRNVSVEYKGLKLNASNLCEKRKLASNQVEVNCYFAI